MSDLVGNPEDRFSRNAVYILKINGQLFIQKVEKSLLHRGKNNNSDLIKNIRNKSLWKKNMIYALVLISNEYVYVYL